MSLLISSEEMAVLLRNDLSSFIVRVFEELNPSTIYADNWHIHLIASALNDVRLGDCKRLVINIPPRNMKSICASIAFPAWLLGLNPSIRIICASYGQELADKLALDTRTIMQTQWYTDLFPGTILAKSSVHDLQTTEQGGRLSTSIGGVLTGRGAEILIIDDPVKPDDAMSEVIRSKANDWYSNTAYSRLNDKEEGAVIIIMQRLHLDDMVGHVLQQEGWTIINLPAIAEEDTFYTFNTFAGEETIYRKTGEALHPARESLETLAEIRATIGEYNFAGQYLQRPVPAGGSIIKTDWLQYMPETLFPETYDRIIQSWDTASKSNELADYSVCTTWGEKKGKLYLLNVWRNRVDFPDLKRAAFHLNEQYNPSIILVEDKSSGIALIQELKSMGIHTVKEFKPEGDKVMRLHTQSIKFESGQIYLPQHANWLTEYVNEVTSFPRCKNDDQVDSTTQALIYLSGPKSPGGLFEYYRILAEEKQAGRYMG